MYQVGDQFVYGIHGICRIAELEERTVGKNKFVYYVLEPRDGGDSRFYVPVHNQAAVAKLRKLMTRQELDALLASREVRQDAWIADENQRKQVYRELIGSGDRVRLVSMIGSLYRHKERQAAAGRKFHLCDENFLRDAERVLRGEFAEVLDIPPEQVTEYILKAIHADE